MLLAGLFMAQGISTLS
jgi:hypothetical protein